MKKRNIIIILLLIMLVSVILIKVSNSSITINEFKNNDFSLSYDSTWKIKKDDNYLELVHKKSKSVLKIQSKELDTIYIDTKLSDIVDDLRYSIEKQNEGYNLIDSLDSPSTEYDSYSYLYEKDMEQVLVNIYKKNNKIIVVYYSSNSEYFDIVLDSVDIILDSLEIIYK